MDNGDVRNSVSGHADQLVQAGVVHGGVHVHHSGGRRLSDAAEAVREALSRHTADEVALRGLYQFGELKVPWEVLPGPDAGTASGERQVLSGPAAVADAFLAMSARRLVLVGDGGSGKSTLALLLARELGERAAADHTIPLPVLTTATSWDPELVHLRVWFVGQLASLYPALDKRLGRDVLVDLVDSGVVFPVLDGLDELPPERRDRVLAALAGTLSPSDTVILTCREGEFREAGGSDSLPALTLRSRPVGREVAEHYLTGGQHGVRQQWAPVIEQLYGEPSGVLASSLDTPLMLWLARRTATATSPQLLADRNRLIDAQAVRNHLLDALIPSVFGAGPSATKSRKNRWQTRKAQTYLSYLARRFSYMYSRDLELSRAAPRSAVLVGQFFLISSLVAILAVIYSTRDRPNDLPSPISQVLFEGSVESVIFYGYRSVTSPDTKWFGRREIILVISLLPAALLVWISDQRDDLQSYLGLLLIFLILSLILHFLRVATRSGRAPDPRGTLKRERKFTLSCIIFYTIISALFVWAPSKQQDVTPVSILTLSVMVSPAVLVFCCTPWGRWHCGRAALAMTGRLPWRTHAFLDHARQLGVIRLSDGHYQFRHITLQKRMTDLATTDQEKPHLYHFNRRLPWRRRWQRSLLLITSALTFVALFSNFDESIQYNLFIVLVGMAWPLAALALLVRRCLLLGTSASVTIDHDRIEVVHRNRHTILAPQDIRRLSVRTMRNSAGHPTRYHAIQAILHDHALSATDTSPPQEWITLISLAPMHPLDTQLREALARFGGSTWEPPLHLSGDHDHLRNIALQERLTGLAAANQTQPQPYRFKRRLPWRLPWRRRWRRSLLLIALALAFVAFFSDYGEGESIRSNLSVVLVGMAWPLAVLVLFVRRCLLLGTSVSVTIDHDRIEVVHRNRHTVLAPQDIRRLSVRTVHDSAGRPTRYHAIQAILHNHALSSTDAPPPQEWITLIPLAPMHPLDTELREALARFGGSAWEPPLRN
ncbi:NACHT domain-containing protein [Streptomyces sp. NPDC048669]|uniref:NACHT domain-containing protein n=1 Tax=Streptomyces sp. NPDC048669 TaxID=3155267 RepID=UPI0034346CC2